MGDEASLLQASQADPRNHELKQALAETYIQAGQWGRAFPLYRELCRDLGERAPRTLLRRLSAFQGKVDAAELAAAFRLVAPADADTAETCYGMLLAGDTAAARRQFESLMDRVFSDRVSGTIWAECFAIACDIVSASPPMAPARPELAASSPQRKVFVGGMGWSGSSAVVDFLSEFDSVATIPGELRHIQGDPGLKTLRRATASPNDFAVELLRFFGLALLGLGVPTSQLAWKSTQLSRQLAFSSDRNRAQAYAAGVRRFLHRIRSEALSTDSIARAGDGLMNDIARAYGATADQWALFDNVVNIRHLGELAALQDLKYFLVVRDPRANYVSYVEGDNTHTGTVHDYIAMYRRIRMQAERDIERISTLHSVVQIQYEEFVLSDALRARTAAMLDLDPATQAKGTRFIQEASAKRVVRWARYAKPQEIDIIAGELPEYCFDASTLV